MKINYFKAACALCFAGTVISPGLSMSATVHLSGGGTNIISDAIKVTSGTASTIIIDDNAVYTETGNIFIGPRATEGHAVSIETPSGQSPTIKLTGGAGFVAYAGTLEDVHVGTPDGGRIKVDGAETAANAVWYIGQSFDRTGPACHLTFENVDFDFTDNLNADTITFGAGGNDAVHTTNNARLTLKNCNIKGGSTAISSLYGGSSSTTNTVELDSCTIIDSIEFGTSPIIFGKYGLNTATCEMQINNSVVYLSGDLVAAENNGVLAFTGFLSINHSDIILDEKTTSAASRGVVGLAADTYISVSNSIIRADVATVLFSGTGGVADSNVSAFTLNNVGFNYVNTIEEWPVYAYVGKDTTLPEFFKVLSNTASATHGTQPPIGSQGVIPSAEVSDWSVY